MSEAPSSLREEVVDLFATWGATANPANAVLLRCLVTETDPFREELDRLLSRAEHFPAPEYAQDLELVREASHQGRLTPDIRLSFLEASERLRLGLQERVSQQQDALRLRMEPWLDLLGPERTGPLLDTLWRPGRTEETEGLLDATENLAATDRAFSEALRDFSVSIAKLDRTDDNAAALSRAEQALEKQDAEAFRAAWGSLRKEMDRSREKETQDALFKESQALEAQLPALEKRPESSGGPGIARLCREILNATERGNTIDADSALRTVRAARADVEALSGELGDFDADQARSRIAERLGLGSANLDPSEPGFYSQVGRALAQRSDGASKASPAPETVKVVKELESTLAKEAEWVDAVRLAEARRGVARARRELRENSVPSSDSQALLEGFRDSIAKAGKQARAQRADQQAGQKSQLTARAKPLRDFVPRSEFAAVQARIDSDPEQAEQQVVELELRAQNLLREEGWAYLAATGGKDKDPALSGLRKCLEGEELQPLAAAVEQARGTGLLETQARRRWIRSGVISAAILALLGVVWVAKSFIGQPDTYTVRVAPDGGTKLTLVQDGEVFAEQAIDPNGNAFKLPNGSYELFVDDKWTGEAIVVPGSPQDFSSQGLAPTRAGQP